MLLVTPIFHRNFAIIPELLHLSELLCQIKYTLYASNFLSFALSYFTLISWLRLSPSVPVCLISLTLTTP